MLQHSECPVTIQCALCTGQWLPEWQPLSSHRFGTTVSSPAGSLTQLPSQHRGGPLKSTPTVLTEPG